MIIMIMPTTIMAAKKPLKCDQLTEFTNDVIVVTSKTRKFPTNTQELEVYCKLVSYIKFLIFD